MSPRGAIRGSSRADGRATHERILVVAGRLFSERGADASLNEVAQRVGIAPATLYRHFPGREALLDALLRERFDELSGLATQLLEAEDAGDGLQRWLEAFIAHLMTYRGLSVAMMDTLCDPSSDLFASCAAMRTAAVGLLARAKETGHVRPEVDDDDVLALANAIAWAVERAPDRTTVSGMLELLGDGIRSVPPRPA